MNSPSTSKKTWFVFSGGGARGCWQWDLFHLLAPLFDIVGCCGTSTGSLTAMAAALGIPYEYLDKLFEQVFASNAKQIFKPVYAQIKDGKLQINKVKLIWKITWGLKDLQGLMTIDPLIETIERLLTEFPEWKYQFAFNVVDLHTGNRVRLTPQDFDDRHELARGIAASCAIPGLVGPVMDIVTKTGTIRCSIDGGARDGFPLKQAFDSMLPNESYQAVGLGCNAKELTPVDELNNVVDFLGAAANIVLNENTLGDMAEVELVNDLIKEKGEEVMSKKYVPLTLILYKGGRGTLEFTPAARLSMKQTAVEDYERFVKTLGMTT